MPKYFLYNQDHHYLLDAMHFYHHMQNEQKPMMQSRNDGQKPNFGPYLSLNGPNFAPNLFLTTETIRTARNHYCLSLCAKYKKSHE